MNYLKISNWDKWQSYRSDRGQPPWVKIHRRLLRSVSWHELGDAEKGQLVSMWMLAADRDGEIPANPLIIQKFCGLQKPPNLQLFIDLGFIERGANVTPERRQVDASVTPQFRGVQSSTEAEVPSEPSSGKPDKIPYAEIVDYLNLRSESNYKATSEATRKHIRARWNDGHRTEDFKKVIDKTCMAWKNKPRMAPFLRPTTIFNSKFDAYLNQPIAVIDDGSQKTFQSSANVEDIERKRQERVKREREEDLAKYGE